MIVDAHNDLLLELALRHEETNAFGTRWLPQLQVGGVGLQVCPLYAANAPPGEARERALVQARELARAVEENEADVFQVCSRGDLDEAGPGRIGLLLSLEGVEALDGDPAAFDDFYELGVRVVGLTWNYRNAFASGIDDQAHGLTERGRELVARFRELGVVLDLAHASDRTWRDALEEDVQIVVTHAGCRDVLDHPRNLAGWQLDALAERGGVLGIMGLAVVVDPEQPTLERYADHLDHAVSVMGVAQVGLGADFIDQLGAAESELGHDDEMPPAMVEALHAGKTRFGLVGFTGPGDYPRLVETLRGRGYAGDRLEAVLAGNWLRVLRATLPSS